ncbi:hypothetical protein HFO77_12070 [Rhizobium leguminosarum]|uniref:hypothetical protein n=1 Tax=Rhizobium leguminosarum TaxID=384 RepID=UPI001C95FAF7|nr:hypothetical protein [Rhizobium leguminosarum]MBY5915152.1 hypothetical protein [Rhizobium leguminosarum]
MAIIAEILTRRDLHHVLGFRLGFFVNACRDTSSTLWVAGHKSQSAVEVCMVVFQPTRQAVEIGDIASPGDQRGHDRLRRVFRKVALRGPA